MRALAGVMIGLFVVAAVRSPGAPGRELSVRTLAQGSHSGVATTSGRVVRDEATYRQLWREIGRDGAPPRVDFAREMVLAVFLGERPTGGYQVEVQRVTQQGQNLTVAVRSVGPPPGAVVAQVITTPFHLVAVPRVSGQVRFVGLEARRPSRGPRESRPLAPPGVDPGESPRGEAVRPQSAAVVEGEPLPVRDLVRGTSSAIRDRRMVVIRSLQVFRELWREHTARQLDPAPLPEVDFDREMVLAAFMGEQRTGGYLIEITGARASDREVVALLREVRPAPDAILTQALTQPHHFVAAPRRELPVRFLLPAAPAGTQPRELASGLQSGIAERTLAVIDSPRAWREFWSRHVVGVQPPPEPPRVDFAREVVLVAVMGEQQIAGYAIRIQEIRYRDGEVVVCVGERRPVGGERLPVRNTPFHFVAIPRPDRPVRFEIVPLRRD